MVRLRMPDGIMALEGKGELERMFKFIVTNNPVAFKTAVAVKPGTQAYICNDEYTLKIPTLCLTLYIWKGSQVIIE